MNENYMANEAQGGSAVMTFIAGAVIGAGVALLLAPCSGEETRRRLGDTARRWRDEGKNRVNQARETINEIREDAKQAIETGREAFAQGRRQRAESHDAERPYSEAGASRPL
jgi:gas vesicle protein